MSVKIFILLAMSLLSSLFFCKPSIKSAYPAIKESSGYVDTFRAKYQKDLGGGVLKKYEFDNYAGMLNDFKTVEGKIFRKLIFGDSINSFIGYARQDEEGLKFLDSLSNDLKDEKTLLFFNKKNSEQWKIDIGDDYFWRKIVTFRGIERQNGSDIYIYDFDPDGNYSGTYLLNKIRYSKETGFVSLGFSSHWSNVIAYKIHRK